MEYNKPIEYYKCDKKDKHRYLLGTQGEKTLVAVCLNPSTANKEKPDRTVDRIMKFSETYGYDSFLVLNLYPKREKNPKNLDISGDLLQIKENIKMAIRSVQKLKNYDIFCAWGIDIFSRKYLIKSAKIIMEEISKKAGNVFTFGELTAKGHPRHPSRLSYKTSRDPFDFVEYFEKKLN